MMDRVEAKEIRAYEAAPTLRRWHAQLWDTRMTQLRTLVRQRLMLTSVGSVVTTAVLDRDAVDRADPRRSRVDHDRRRRGRHRRPAAAQQPAAGRAGRHSAACTKA